MAMRTTAPTKRRTIAKGKGEKAHPRQTRKAIALATGRNVRRDYAEQIGVLAKDTLDLVKHVEKGLSFSVVESLQQQMKMATKDMSQVLDIKFRTFLRRKQAGRLQPAESDRVLRTSRLFARATDLFNGNRDAARRWLMSPQRALGGAVPMEIARTEIGAREVEKIIGRLEQGVFT